MNGPISAALANVRSGISQKVAILLIRSKNDQLREL